MQPIRRTRAFRWRRRGCTTLLQVSLLATVGLWTRSPTFGRGAPTFTRASEPGRVLAPRASPERLGASNTEFQPGSQRRAVLTAPLAGAALWAVVAEPAAGEPTGRRAEVAAALLALRALQARWADFSAAGEAGGQLAGEAVVQALGTSLERTLAITVPEGKPLGVEIDGKNVVGLNQKGMGFQLSDTIEQVNGAVAEDQEDLMQKIKGAKEKGGPIVLTVTRREKSPFVSIGTALRLVYEDTTSPLPETDDVMSKIGALKSKASLLVDGVGSVEDVRKRLDSIAMDLEAYVDSVPLSAGRVTKRAAADGDLSDLFG